MAFCVLCLLAVAAVAKAGGESAPAIHIQGNYLFCEEVYQAIVKFPPGAAADRATSRVVAQQLVRFLHDAGFVLASVEARAENDAIEVTVDEGRIEKIVFIGTSSIMALRLKLELNLPHHIFNKPSLDRQLRQFSEKHNFKDVTYKLVPTRQKKHTGPQLSNLLTIEGHDLVPPESHYELQIKVGSTDWGTGFDIKLTYDFPDGFEPSVSYQSENLLFDGDRWQVGGAVGGKLRTHLDNKKPYLVLSRLEAEGRYYTPPLFGTHLRPFAWLVTDLTSRQRADLQIDIYYSERLEASINLGYDIVPGLLVFVGGGAGQRYFTGFIYTAAAEAAGDTVPAPNQFRPFAVGRVEWLFNPNELRRDLRHVLSFEERHIWSSPGGQFDRLSALYKRIFGFGWNDLRIKTSGVWVGGPGATFDDQEPVGGRYVRGVFGDRYYAWHVANLSLEFRLSISRDVYKVSVFHDLAVFGALTYSKDSQTFDEALAAANSFGVGFHILILDLFQLDLYYAIGFDTKKNFDHGIAVSLTNVF